VITRIDLVNSPLYWQSAVDGVTQSWSYTIDPETCPPEQFQLNSGQAMRARITFSVPHGQYQFLFGYGGGVHQEKSLASNSISFDFGDDGIATLVE
jgi:hypothetical protein